MTIYLVSSVLEWYRSRKRWWLMQKLAIHNIHWHAKVVRMPVKCHKHYPMHYFVSFLSLAAANKKNEYTGVSDCTSSCLYVVLLGLSPTFLSFRAVLWCTTFEICPEAAGVSSESKQIYFPRGKIHNFPSATSPVLLKTGWESGCRSLSSGDWV